MKMYILSLCLILFCVLMISNGKIANASNTPFWDNILAKYQTNQRVKQLIFVKYQGGTDAQLELYEKDMDNQWEKVLSCAGYVGKNGLGKTVEGDMKTPRGDYGIFTAAGIEPNPGTKADYLLLDEHIFCADGAYYNKLIDDRELSKEVLDKLDLDPMNNGAPQFNYGLFIDYNRECKEGLGSYIFLHCFGEDQYTHGCVAVSEENMIKILQHVDNNVRICIYPK